MIPRLTPARFVTPGRFVVTVALGAGLAGCAPAAEPAGSMRLTIVSERWSGWSTTRSQPEVATIQARVGERAAAAGLPSPQVFEVAAVGPGSAELTFGGSRLTSDQARGGIDLRQTIDRVTVEVGRTAQLSTPTTDTGVTYRITLTPATSS